MSLLKQRNLVMVTGAGASISFGFPSTLDFTGLIESSLRSDRRASSKVLSLYDSIVTSLKNYLVRPGLVTFEDIYQSIQDVRTIQSIPNDPRAFDEFRPRVGATHVLNSHLSCYSNQEGQILQDVYLDNLLDTFLRALPSVSGMSELSAALKQIEKEFAVWSFTLNYDNIIGDVWADFISGFAPGDAPRFFSPDLLLGALDSGIPIHSHLHGSLKWGFPIEGSGNPFELHELDSPGDGVRNSKSRPSGRPAQRGETLPSSPIITGLDKAELVFRQPFFTNFLAFFRSLSLCSDVLISGYSFSDRHVNMGIGQCRRYRPDVGTYIVDKDSYNHPSSYLDTLTPDAWHVLLPGDAMRAREVPERPGWWKVPGLSGNGLKTAPIFLWLKGFDTFCEAVVNHGFPNPT